MTAVRSLFNFKKLIISILVLLAACNTAPAQTSPTPPSVVDPGETKLPQMTASAPAQQTPSLLSGNELFVPFPAAPLCPDTGEAHDGSLFHTLWDGTRGCHYDHEHGQNPFTAEVSTIFLGMDLYALLGGVGVGHTNPSSPMENTHKHGGFKWDVTLTHSVGCVGGDGYLTGVDALVIQYHAFGDYSIEFESRTHSTAGLLRQCQIGNPTDFGYIFVNQLQDYGQRVAPYQGDILPYPDNPTPAYDSGRAPYFTVSCFGNTPQCNKFPSRESILDRTNSAASTWISARGRLTDSGSHLFALLFRVRDTYQILDDGDTTYPFTFAWLCSKDDGVSYAPEPGCPYNNSTTRIHEVMGEIPVEWDNLTGFDTDPRIGRITATGFVTRFGELNTACVAPGTDCHPIKLIQAFTGPYLSQFSLVSGQKATFSPENLPERDIYFCDNVVCADGDPGAESSGWIGPGN